MPSQLLAWLVVVPTAAVVGGDHSLVRDSSTARKRRHMKKFAFGALWVALAVQALWIVVRIIRQPATPGSVSYPAAVTVAFAALVVTRGRYRWIAGVLRMFVGVAFLSAVCDRFGILGPPGTPGISWGNFRNFTAYTAQVNSFLPAATIPALAVVESIIEGALGLAMLVGAFLHVTAWASSALLFVFGIAMTVSLGVASQFPFAVFVLAAGTWVLAVLDPSFASIDALAARMGYTRHSTHARYPHWNQRRARESR